MAVGSRLFRLHLFMILETSNQIQQAVIILKLQMNIPYIGSQFEFNKLFLQGKGFWKLPRQRTVVGVGWELEISNAPFLNFKINGVQMVYLGRKTILRGYSKSVLSRSLWFTNVELRYRFLETN
jgi:hypothetical protein